MSTTDLAVFGHASFWEAEELFRGLRGVLQTTVGYCGGTRAHPTYHTKSDHTESVRVVFSRQQTSFEELARHFISRAFSASDVPVTPDGKALLTACPTIFYLDDHQKNVTRDIWRQLRPLWPPQATLRLTPGKTFYEAEPYHQQFLSRLNNG